MRLALFIGNCIQSYENEVISAMHRISRARGYTLDVFANCVVPDGDYLHIEGLKKVFTLSNLRNYDGIISCDDTLHNYEMNLDLRKHLGGASCPVVCLRNSVEGCYNVVFDDRQEMYNMTKHIINDHGAKDIGFVTGSFDLDDTTNRLSGFMDAMLEADKKATAKEQDSSSKEEVKTKGETNSIVNRYDNEGEFFEILDRESPIMHNLITDKIKYFDPAFHSISPEGFNARLTFLHQCTRQGATIEQGDPNAISAYNLAFGRPPVCVLRLGDFYYTKIIISGLNIRYENPQWDLNPEGIGVMPMFANITINFTFLGGSDLAGPIARLQNAVSFNYYANTGVYDNRAEMVMYEGNGSGREKKFKGYIYPNPTKN
jgi:hypothetical protein